MVNNKNFLYSAPVEGVGMDMALIDSTIEHQEKTFFGINMEHVNKTWKAIKRIIISAGDQARKPYHLEEQHFVRSRNFKTHKLRDFWMILLSTNRLLYI